MNKSTLALLLALVTAPALSAQNLIVNGSFDSTNFGAPTYNNGGTPVGGATDISGTGGVTALTTGWTAVVPSGYAVTFYNAASGSGYPTAVDGGFMYNVGGFNNAKGQGGIYQDFTTVMGQSYQLIYYLSSMPGAGVLNGVSVNTQILDAGNSFNAITGSGVQSTTSESFVVQGFTFTAGSTSTRLSFTDMTSGISQLNIDAVSVTAIPEPSTYAAMAGAAMLGLAVWRRRQVAAAPVAA